MNEAMVRPRSIKPGDTIRVISPSWFGGKTFVRRAMRGVRLLESLGYVVEIAAHAFENDGHVSAPTAHRLEDFHNAFKDDRVAMVLATIGGTHAADLLPGIDWNLIRDNPKIFMGFSDNTILHTALRVKTGLTTFYGPGLLTDWAEYPTMPEFAVQTALNAITRGEGSWDIPEAGEWTDEFLDWETGEDESRNRQYFQTRNRKAINPGVSCGTTIGGCIETLQHLRGTEFWPNLDGAVLCLETSEECLSPESLDIMLADYALMGVFDCIKGLLLAKPYGFTDEQYEQFESYVFERTAGYNFPVIINMDFGHTTPMITMPLGANIRVDADACRVTVLGPTVS